MKAAKKMAAKAPVATCWEMATAALVGVALAAETADADPEAADTEVAILVAEVADEAIDPPEPLSTADEFRVPHF